MARLSELFNDTRLKRDVRSAILSKLASVGLEKDFGCYLVGDLATDLFHSLSPIQLVVTLDKTDANEFNESIGRYLTNTTIPGIDRKVAITFQNGVVDLADHVAVYDVRNNVWFKGDPTRIAQKITDYANQPVKSHPREQISIDFGEPVTEDQVREWLKGFPGSTRVDSVNGGSAHITTYSELAQKLETYFSSGDFLKPRAVRKPQVSDETSSYDIQLPTGVELETLEQYLGGYKPLPYITEQVGPKKWKFETYTAYGDKLKQALDTFFDKVSQPKEQRLSPPAGLTQNKLPAGQNAKPLIDPARNKSPIESKNIPNPKKPDILPEGQKPTILTTLQVAIPEKGKRYFLNALKLFKGVKIVAENDGILTLSFSDPRLRGEFESYIRRLYPNIRIASRRNASAFIHDVAFEDLPKDTQKDIKQFFPDIKASVHIPSYGMVVDELLPKADPHNLESAREHVKDTSVTKLEKEIYDKADTKYLLLVNDRLIDGHHYLTKAERAGVTRTLRVLDLTAVRFQKRKAQFTSPRADYWLSPSGQWLRVTSSHTDTAATMIVPDLGASIVWRNWMKEGMPENDDFSIETTNREIMNATFQKGWVRIVVDAGNLLTDGAKPLTNKQKRELRDTAIEHGLRYGVKNVEQLLKSTEDHQKTIAVDLDGTILDYDGWKGEDHFGKPKEGAKETLEDLKKRGWKIIIYTTRGNEKLVRKELEKYGIPFDLINKNDEQPKGSSDKPLADVYLDDRAIRFTNWDDALKEIDSKVVTARRAIKIVAQYGGYEYYWLSPSGEWIKVKGHGQYLPTILGISVKEFYEAEDEDDFYAKAFQMGWIRVVVDTNLNEVIWNNGHQRLLSNEQKRQLKDDAIERGYQLIRGQKQVITLSERKCGQRNNGLEARAGDTICHEADGRFKVVDFGSWPEMKAKYPAGAEFALASKSTDVPEEKMGRTWVLKQNGEEYCVGSGYMEDTFICNGFELKQKQVIALSERQAKLIPGYENATLGFCDDGIGIVFVTESPITHQPRINFFVYPETEIEDYKKSDLTPASFIQSHPPTLHQVYHIDTAEGHDTPTRQGIIPLEELDTTLESLQGQLQNSIEVPYKDVVGGIMRLLSADVVQDEQVALSSGGSYF